MGSFDKPPGIPSAKEIQEIPALSLHRDPQVDFGQNVTKLTIDRGVVQAPGHLAKNIQQAECHEIHNVTSITYGEAGSRLVRIRRAANGYCNLPWWRPKTLCKH